MRRTVNRLIIKYQINYIIKITSDDTELLHENVVNCWGAQVRVSADRFIFTQKHKKSFKKII